MLCFAAKSIISWVSFRPPMQLPERVFLPVHSYFCKLDTGPIIGDWGRPAERKKRKRQILTHYERKCGKFKRFFRRTNHDNLPVRLHQIDQWNNGVDSRNGINNSIHGTSCSLLIQSVIDETQFVLINWLCCNLQDLYIIW